MTETRKLAADLFLMVIAGVAGVLAEAAWVLS